MLAQIAELSDEGLRRNYLNKVEINREIVLEWTSQAARRGQAVALFTQHEPAQANLEQQFGRLLEIGRRLASQRDLDQLPDDILQAFVELCGAERCFLAARPGDSPDLRILASTGVDNIETLMAEADPILDAALTSRFAVIRETMGDSPLGDVPELVRRSAIAVPLVFQNQSLGVLYGDMREIFGRFNQTDVDLLTILANQAAVALENANWTHTLEQKVADSTAELHTRLR